MRKNFDLRSGDLKGHLVRLTLPSIGGMAAIVAFNLVDTYFVSKLGTSALAAMGFTFPVVMVIGSLASGVSMGAASILARAMGAGDHHKMARIASDGILLSVLAVILIGLLGIVTMDPLFTALGADKEVLPLVKDYMTVWYLGVVVVILPPVSDASMRAIGDMIRPLLVMLVCAVMNFILDPIMIFGYFGFPAMGIEGAALATVISRAFGMVLTLSFVHFKYKLINFRYDSISSLIKSWQEILVIGLPNALVRLLPQVTRSMMTKLTASLIGATGVAALAAGNRVESLATIFSMAIGVAIIPLVGQNYGAGHYDRVIAMRRLMTKMAIFYGLALMVLAVLVGKPILKFFGEDSSFITYGWQYLLLVFVGAIGLNMYNWISESFNALGKPILTLRINLIGTLVIILPLLFLGSKLYGYLGMLIGLSLGQIIVGFYSRQLAIKEIDGLLLPSSRDK